MTDKNVPKIRFPGFSDPWEQRKLAEIGTIATGNTPKTDVKAFYSESGTPWITPSDIKDGKVYKPSRYLSPEGIKTARLMPAGSILVTCIASIGKNTLLTEESAFNQQINGLTPSKLSDSYFLFTDSSQWSEKMKRIAAAQTMQIINKSEFSHLETMIPSFPEQQMVGKFFYNVDNLITLHQRKLDDLKSLKSGLLQKMFPKPGSAFPEVRFPEFTDPWEQRKLGDFSTKVSSKNIDGVYSNTLTNSAEYGIIDQNDYFDKSISNPDNIKGYYIVHLDDFVYNPRISNLAPCGPIKRNKQYKTGIMSPLYTVFKVRDVDKSFLEVYFETDNWHPFMRFHGDTGARSDRFAIKDKSFFEMPIMLPSGLEQTKISNLFNIIDKAITLHQRKLENLKLLKQGLLQQMFV